MSIITEPVAWKLVQIARRLPNSEKPQRKTSSAVAFREGQVNLGSGRLTKPPLRPI